MRQVPLIRARAGDRRTGGAPALPRGACDCHVHLFGAPERYPLSPARAYTPGLAEVADAEALIGTLGLERLVLVQPSAYGLDNACLKDGLAALGDRARGIAVVPADADDQMLSDLDAAGVRGLRLNLGGPDEDATGTNLATELRACAARLADTRWLVQLHAPWAALMEAGDVIASLSTPLVIDHFANIPAAAMPHHPACGAVEAMLERGETYLKLSAPYRIARSRADLGRLRGWVEKLATRRPERLLWGSDWPHTPPHGRHVEPEDSVGFREVDAGADLSHLLSWIGDGVTREKVLASNPERLFGFAEAPGAR